MNFMEGTFEPELNSNLYNCLNNIYKFVLLKRIYLFIYNKKKTSELK